jgi:23S rRNA pseudouridine1911/1915/1917 synthase
LTDVPPPGREAAVLWDDGRLLVVSKPPGVSLATRRSAPGQAVARLLGAMPAAERAEHGLDPGSLWLVHRLDVGTSGVLLLARDEETHRCLAGLLAARLVGKEYLALVWGHPKPAAGEMALPLGPDRADRRRMRVAREDGRPALTRYRVVGRAPGVALVHATPATGRTHQIRVHLAAIGHPVVGDDLYGGPRHHGVRDPRVRALLAPDHPFLHAWRVSLPRSECTPELILTAPLPADFAAALAALGLEGRLEG